MAVDGCVSYFFLVVAFLVFPRWRICGGALEVGHDAAAPLLKRCLFPRQARAKTVAKEGRGEAMRAPTVESLVLEGEDDEDGGRCEPASSQEGHGSTRKCQKIEIRVDTCRRQQQQMQQGAIMGPIVSRDQ